VGDILSKRKYSFGNMGKKECRSSLRDPWELSSFLPLHIFPKKTQGARFLNSLFAVA
jgi:hypothetical protein